MSARMHSRPDGRNLGQAGFSLIEAMVTLVVLSVGMIGIASLYGQGLGASRTALYRTVAVNLASDMADRIRGNRLGAASFQTPANHNCDPEGGGGVNCSPQDMAQHDRFMWSREVTRRLPNGVGTVNVAVGTPTTYTIQVSWAETGLGTISEQMVVQVPSF
jgi:type IV pilus assembly protein PilV